MDEDGWTVVKKKERKPRDPFKVKYYTTSTPTDYDRYLTKEERAKVKSDPSIFCNCCQCREISAIIKRPFVGCGNCHCCW